MIAVFVDTNILHCKNQLLDRVEFIEKLQDIVYDIEVNDIYTEVKILIPNMVIHELYQQQLEAYMEWKKKLEKIKLPNMVFDNEFDYKPYLSKIFRDAMQKVKHSVVDIDVVDFPDNEKFNKVILRAIEKLPPFEGKDKQSDKGFKDVVIWETIKEYKEKHINDIIVFCCNDILLSSSILKAEFCKEFRDEIYIEQKDQLMNRLALLCDKKEVVKTFSSQLKERIEKSLSHRNAVFYDWMMDDVIWNDGDTISGFEVNKVSIINCDDQKIHNRILYNVEIEIKMIYSHLRDREMYKLIGEREFDIYYDFETDELLLKSYDLLTLGRCELSDYVPIEN